MRAATPGALFSAAFACACLLLWQARALGVLRRELRRADASGSKLPLSQPVSDLYLRRLGGGLDEDAVHTQRHVLAIAVGTRQVDVVDACVRRFPASAFSIVLFHYDTVTDLSEYGALDWAGRAVHVAAKSQSKWWFAKRFLSPATVGDYDTVWVWDEDLDCEHFDPSAFLHIFAAADLAIAQPAIEGRVSWPITQRVEGAELHRRSPWKAWGERCSPAEAELPPCAALVEMQAPVFSRRAWDCVWHLLQNDLVHAFGVDLSWHFCAASPGRAAADAMAVIDAVWLTHLSLPTLGEQGVASAGEPAWANVHRRRSEEWDAWNERWGRAMAENGG